MTHSLSALVDALLKASRELGDFEKRIKMLDDIAGKILDSINKLLAKNAKKHGSGVFRDLVSIVVTSEDLQKVGIDRRRYSRSSLYYDDKIYIHLLSDNRNPDVIRISILADFDNVDNVIGGVVVHGDKCRNLLRLVALALKADEIISELNSVLSKTASTVNILQNLILSIRDSLSDIIALEET